MYLTDEMNLGRMPSDDLGMASPSQIATVRGMLKQGKSFPEILAVAPDGAVGEVWRRRPMLQFASSLARKGSLAPAVAIATASQWHNCRISNASYGIPTK
jgi:hypothetical protein